MNKIKKIVESIKVIIYVMSELGYIMRTGAFIAIVMAKRTTIYNLDKECEERIKQKSVDMTYGIEDKELIEDIVNRIINEEIFGIAF